MMAILTRIIEQLATLLVAMGIPTASATMYALILIYLLVTGLIAGLLLFIFVRRHQCEKKRIVPSDRES